jgi:hypothetical protein
MKLLMILVLWGLFLTATGPNWMTVCVGILVLCSLQDAKPASANLPAKPVAPLAKLMSPSREQMAEAEEMDEFFESIGEVKVPMPIPPLPTLVYLHPPREAGRGQQA